MSYMPRRSDFGGEDPRPHILDKTITMLEDDMRRLSADIDLIQAAYTCADRVLKMYCHITGHYLELATQDVEDVQALYDNAETEHILINAHQYVLNEKRDRDLDEMRSL